VSSQPIIFLIEEDDETRSILKDHLKREGYHVLLALDEEDAMERISGRQLNADLVLMNLVGKSTDEVLSAGRRIREHAKFDGHTPIVVIADKYGNDLAGTDINVAGNDWVLYLGEEANQLENLLHRLLLAA
jgi:DNA-binding response OmpR family regulator